MRDAFTIATWCCRRWRVFDRSNPFPGCGRGLHQGPSKRGAAGLEPASASGSAIELHPWRTVINPSANARPQAPASYWRSTGRKTIHGSAAARTRSRDPSTTESSPDRIRIRERFAGGAGLEPATYGSKDRRAAKLHHPPIPSWPARPRWSRFARPITRWTPSAGAGGDGHCPPVRHHALLGLPRQGGCRRGLNMCPMPAVILTPNGWRTLRTRPGFEPGSPPTEGGVLPLHQQATHTPIKQGVRPECRIRFHRQRQGTVCVSSVLSAPSVGSLTQL